MKELEERVLCFVSENPRQKDSVDIVIHCNPTRADITMEAISKLEDSGHIKRIPVFGLGQYRYIPLKS